MVKMLAAIAVLCAVFSAPAGRAYAAPAADELSAETSSQPVNQVVQWNRTLLAIVRTKGAQPATIHPTRSFAMMHAAIYDAVNAIDGTHKPYLVHITTASPAASEDAAAAQSAHDVLVNLYPQSRHALDSQLKQALAQIPDGTDKDDGVTIGKTAAAGILGARTNDGSSAKPPVFVDAIASVAFEIRVVKPF